MYLFRWPSRLFIRCCEGSKSFAAVRSLRKPPCGYGGCTVALFWPAQELAAHGGSVDGERLCLGRVPINSLGKRGSLKVRFAPKSG